MVSNCDLITRNKDYHLIRKCAYNLTIISPMSKCRASVLTVSHGAVTLPKCDDIAVTAVDFPC